MDLISVVNRFPDQHACIAHLESVRWKDEPYCPYCGGMKVARKRENNRIGRWNCFDCYSSFNVLQGTIFHKTKIPLQKWFVAIALMVNAKKSLSSCQMARDLDMNQNSCWYMQQRIRAAMLSEQFDLLKGIVEVDETSLGGMPRYDKKYYENPYPIKRGRGTRKTAVIGAVSRGGKVIAKVARDLSGAAILKFLKEFLDVDNTTLMTDEYRGYRSAGEIMDHMRINHQESYVDGDVHTNTIEGFWALLKRALYGQHHHYSKYFTPLYVAEACWKYNRRKEEAPDTFKGFLSAIASPV